ncbi:3-oxoacyl-ACP reductase family protein [Isoptericola croceus]|uniref:3-oxoacyl-ACP reductase family protein n=1 Tax=Isoptericola croceus TaxID=3031406 RepID=UPI0023F76C18|nr:3-oxoacyl-ACP reductase family protein [Isoptericola croceus]
MVTGGSRGIGRAVSADLARHGVHVVVNYSRSEQPAKELVSEIEAEGGSAQAVQADVTDEDAVQALFRTVRSEHGRLDVLVTSAGVTNDRHLVAMSRDLFQQTMDVNLTGTFLACREAMRIMQHQRYGSIVTISSASGMDGGFPGQTNYVASKGAIIAFSKALAFEAVTHGIRVNVVAPGFVETDMVRRIPQKIRESYAARVRIGRMGRPQEIANLATFLASEKASYVTGEVLVANGGGLG